jgi:hypothetical protein
MEKTKDEKVINKRNENEKINSKKYLAKFCSIKKMLENNI